MTALLRPLLALALLGALLAALFRVVEVRTDMADFLPPPAPPPRPSCSTNSAAARRRACC
ncbi:hypothetical protein ACE7GA_08260 [Roseomonas sp. CCTCC AB2023176]|uniref:hypothetical protein n=1 Tax=Roseomonas sp. CCTCC AB2023176 TaxID=3342640 RepID=UPI0035DE1323